MRALPLLFLGACLFGCTLAEMSRQNEAAINRIDTKMQVLQEQHDKQEELLAYQKELLRQQKDQQRTINKLTTDLDNLRREIARVNIENESQRRKKNEIEARLRTIQNEIERLKKEPPPQDQAATNEKEARLEELKKQIETQLKIIREL